MPPRPMNQAAIERLVTERVIAAVEAKRQRQVNARGQGNNEVGGQGGAPAARESRKVKFAAATLQGRALTWWNSQVATMGLEAANQKELIVALRGEIYFVKFIINPKEDDVEPGVIFERSFLRMTKAIADFGAGTVTIYPDIDLFLEETKEEEKSNDD
ncbi:hypothetical protein Tco_1208939 [Tanacetum coccineum]